MFFFVFFSFILLFSSSTSRPHRQCGDQLINLTKRACGGYVDWPREKGETLREHCCRRNLGCTLDYIQQYCSTEAPSRF